MLRQAQLDNFVRLACLLCDAPMGIISFVSNCGERSYGAEGVQDVEQICRSKLFTEVETSNNVVWSLQISNDTRFREEPVVVDDSRLQFFVGLPLLLPEVSSHVGVLCVMDTRPRPPMTCKVQVALELLAQQVVEALKLWDEAQEKEKLFNRCLPLICHELNTPLNGIVGLSALSNLPEGETILRSAGLALRVLERLTDYSQLHMGKLELQAAPFNIRDCIEDTLAMTEPLFGHLCVRYELAKDFQVVGDEQRLKQVLRILLENASKFTKTGEVVLRVNCPEALVSDGEEATELTFEVQDSGIGISSDVAKQLFHPFSVGDYSSTREHSGTGLGLVIAQAICRAMQGAIWFDSQPDQGSRFYFTVKVPVRRCASFRLSISTPTLDRLMLEGAGQSTDSNDDGGAGNAPTLSILIADDNKINQRVLLGFVQRLGYSADVVDNGLEAVQAFAQKNYDLLLTDVEMPVMDGLQATRQLRTLFGARTPYIVGVSANSLDTNRQRCLEAGMQQFLPKPIRFESIRQAVDAALAQVAAPKPKPKRPLRLQRLLPCRSPPAGHQVPTPPPPGSAQLNPLRLGKRPSPMSPHGFFSPCVIDEQAIPTPCPPSMPHHGQFPRLGRCADFLNIGM